MKCPYCGVHYDDEEKECPMCGRRKPLLSGVTPSRTAKTTSRPSRSSAERARHPSKNDWPETYTTTTCAHPSQSQKDCDHKTTLNGKTASGGIPSGPQATYNGRTASGAPLPGKQPTLNGKPAKKKKNPLAALIGVIIALNLLGPILTGIMNTAENAFDQFTDLHMDPAFEQDQIAFPDSPAPDESFPAAASFQAGDYTFTLADDATYEVKGPNYSEGGSFDWWQGTDENDYGDAETYPPEQYDYYILTLYMDNNRYTSTDDFNRVVEDYSTSGDHYLSVYVNRDSGETTVVDDLENIFWITGDDAA